MKLYLYNTKWATILERLTQVNIKSNFKNEIFKDFNLIILFLLNRKNGTFFA
jgi:hypothetical protein